jgi:hypothetical protein
MEGVSPPRSPSLSPTTKRRRGGRYTIAARIERCCCVVVTGIPLAFVYGITTWAVYIQSVIGFEKSASMVSGLLGCRLTL